MSSAAYLLFYRRRSSQPLGPPELQELVNKARNTDSSSEDELSNDSSPPRATAGATQRLGIALPGGTTTSTVRNDDSEDEGISMVYDSTPVRGAPIGTYDGKPLLGPVRPGPVDAGWNFSGIDDLTSESHPQDGGVEDIHLSDASTEADTNADMHGQQLEVDAASDRADDGGSAHEVDAVVENGWESEKRYEREESMGDV